MKRFLIFVFILLTCSMYGQVKLKQLERDSIKFSVPTPKDQIIIAGDTSYSQRYIPGLAWLDSLGVNSVQDYYISNDTLYLTTTDSTYAVVVPAGTVIDSFTSTYDEIKLFFNGDSLKTPNFFIPEYHIDIDGPFPPVFPYNDNDYYLQWDSERLSGRVYVRVKVFGTEAWWAIGEIGPNDHFLSRNGDTIRMSSVSPGDVPDNTNLFPDTTLLFNARPRGDSLVFDRFVWDTDAYVKDSVVVAAGSGASIDSFNIASDTAYIYLADTTLKAEITHPYSLEDNIIPNGYLTRSDNFNFSFATNETDYFKINNTYWFENTMTLNESGFTGVHYGLDITDSKIYVQTSNTVTTIYDWTAPNLSTATVNTTNAVGFTVRDIDVNGNYLYRSNATTSEISQYDITDGYSFVDSYDFGTDVLFSFDILNNQMVVLFTDAIKIYDWTNGDLSTLSLNTSFAININDERQIMFKDADELILVDETTDSLFVLDFAGNTGYNTIIPSANNIDGIDFYNEVYFYTASNTSGEPIREYVFSNVDTFFIDNRIYYDTSSSYIASIEIYGDNANVVSFGIVGYDNDTITNLIKVVDEETFSGWQRFDSIFTVPLYDSIKLFFISSDTLLFKNVRMNTYFNTSEDVLAHIDNDLDLIIGNEGNIENGTNTTVNGTGTIGDPYSIDVPDMSDDDWTEGTGTVYNLTDKVGIGKIPTSTLDVLYSGTDAEVLTINASGSSISGSALFSLRLPEAGDKKAFALLKGTDVAAWALYGYNIGGTGKPGFELGDGSSGRDVNIYRDAANLLKTNDDLEVGSKLYVDDLTESPFSLGAWSATGAATDVNLTTGLVFSGSDLVLDFNEFTTDVSGLEGDEFVIVYDPSTAIQEKIDVDFFASYILSVNDGFDLIGNQLNASFDEFPTDLTPEGDEFVITYDPSTLAHEKIDLDDLATYVADGTGTDDQTLSIVNTDDGTLSIESGNTVDLTELIFDQVKAFFTSNTETGITVTPQDGDNTVDFVVSGGTDDQNLSFGSKTTINIPLDIESGVGVIFREGTNVTLDRTASNIMTINATGDGTGTDDQQQIVNFSTYYRLGNESQSGSGISIIPGSGISITGTTGSSGSITISATGGADGNGLWDSGNNNSLMAASLTGYVNNYLSFNNATGSTTILYIDDATTDFVGIRTTTQSNGAYLNVGGPVDISGNTWIDGFLTLGNLSGTPVALLGRTSSNIVTDDITIGDGLDLTSGTLSAVHHAEHFYASSAPAASSSSQDITISGTRVQFGSGAGSVSGGGIVVATGQYMVTVNFVAEQGLGHVDPTFTGTASGIWPDVFYDIGSSEDVCSQTTLVNVTVSGTLTYDVTVIGGTTNEITNFEIIFVKI